LPFDFFWCYHKDRKLKLIYFGFELRQDIKNTDFLTIENQKVANSAMRGGLFSYGGVFNMSTINSERRRSASATQLYALVFSGLTLASASLVGTATAAEVERIAQLPNIELGSTINLALAGTISADCQLSGNEVVDLGELRAGVSAARRLGLTCNLPFDLSLTSDNGALTHTTKPLGEGPFVGTLGYRVLVSIPLDGPISSGTLNGDFTSASLRARKTVDSGTAIAQGGGELQFVALTPGGAGLLAGDYSDRIVVTLNTRL
jgi:spore coat protein U-like protein